MIPFNSYSQALLYVALFFWYNHFICKNILVITTSMRFVFWRQMIKKDRGDNIKGQKKK